MKRESLRLMLAGGFIGVAAATQGTEVVDVHGHAEVGVGNVAMDHPNSKFGEYSGIGDDDTYLVGNLGLFIDSGPVYLNFRADGIGLDSRHLSLEGGEYGVYSLAFDHDEIPHLISTDDRTPFGGAGGERLVLPGGFVRDATTAGMTDLAGSLKSLDLRTDRSENLFRVTKRFAGGWQANLSVRHEDKSGIQSLGGVTAQNGGLADATILPQPVDYRTEEFAASAAYNGTDRQIELGYFLSVFHNEDSSITWDVPFLKSIPTALDYPAVARLSLPPDNKYQRLSVSGGMNFAHSTRISAMLDVGRMTQDDTLLPYSTDDIGGTAALREDGAPLPRSSADAEVDVLHAVVNLSLQPLSGLGVTARYRYYETDNKTPYTLFDRVINDTVAQSATVDIYSRPYDYARSKMELGANYRFSDGTRFKTDFGREITAYDHYRSVKGTEENTLRAGLSRSLTDSLEGRLTYTRAERSADYYDAFLSYSTLVSGLSCPSPVTVNPDPDTGGVTTVDTCFDNHPDLRQFDLASRDRNRLAFSLLYAAEGPFDVSVDVAGNRDVYDDDILFDDTYLGLTSDKTLSVTLDVGYDPHGSWSVDAYYTRERLRSAQAGRAYGNTASSAIDSSLNWTADFLDIMDTVGVTGVVGLLDDNLKLSLSYVYSKAKNRIAFSAGDGLTYEDMPGDGNERQTVAVDAVYKPGDDIGVGLGLGYEKYRAEDWSLDSVVAGGAVLNDVLLLSGPQDDYRAYLVKVTVIYVW